MEMDASLYFHIFSGPRMTFIWDQEIDKNQYTYKQTIQPVTILHNIYNIIIAFAATTRIGAHKVWN